MTAQSGCYPFSSEESIYLDKTIIVPLIKKIFNMKFKNNPRWTLKPILNMSDLVDNNRTAFGKRGKETTRELDGGGAILYDNKVVSIVEVKYQNSNQNACERVHFYGHIFAGRIPNKNYIVVTGGPGFTRHNGHIYWGTGASVAVLEDKKNTIIDGNIDHNELEHQITKILLEIKDETESIENYCLNGLSI